MVVMTLLGRWWCPSSPHHLDDPDLIYYRHLSYLPPYSDHLSRLHGHEEVIERGGCLLPKGGHPGEWAGSRASTHHLIWVPATLGLRMRACPSETEWAWLMAVGCLLPKDGHPGEWAGWWWGSVYLDRVLEEPVPRMEACPLGAGWCRLAAGHRLPKGGRWWEILSSHGTRDPRGPLRVSLLVLHLLPSVSW